MVSLTIYFATYVIIANIFTSGHAVKVVSIGAHIFNTLFTFAGLVLYCYTVLLLRTAIKNCAKFQFDTKGTNLICILYAFLLGLQIFYLMCHKIFKNTMIIVSLLHYFSYFFVMIVVAYFLSRTGTGLRLVPHKLTNGTI